MDHCFIENICKNCGKVEDISKLKLVGNMCFTDGYNLLWSIRYKRVYQINFENRNVFFMDTEVSGTGYKTAIPRCMKIDDVIENLRTGKYRMFIEETYFGCPVSQLRHQSMCVK